MTSILARALRGILATYTKGIIFENRQTDYFEENWSELRPELKTQYLLIIEKIMSEIPFK